MKTKAPEQTAVEIIVKGRGEDGKTHKTILFETSPKAIMTAIDNGIKTAPGNKDKLVPDWVEKKARVRKEDKDKARGKK